MVRFGERLMKEVIGEMGLTKTELYTGDAKGYCYHVSRPDAISFKLVKIERTDNDSSYSNSFRIQDIPRICDDLKALHELYYPVGEEV